VFPERDFNFLKEGSNSMASPSLPHPPLCRYLKLHEALSLSLCPEQGLFKTTDLAAAAALHPRYLKGSPIVHFF